MAKTKNKFANKKAPKTLEQRGILLDPANVNVKIKKIEVTKAELYDELAQDWMTADLAKSRVSPKRQLRILEKVLTAPAFSDELIPLKPDDTNEQVYFMALCKVKDTVLYIQDVLYDELMEGESERRKANEIK